MATDYNKKLEYITETLLPKHLIDQYPKYVDFIRVYLRFLDQTYSDKILKITDNCNTNTVYDELLDDYLNNYFKDVVNLDRYELTSQNKRRLLELSKLIMNSKGNKKSFEALFKSLTDIVIHDPDENTEVDEFNIVYSDSPGNLYTYEFEVDIDFDKVSDLIEQVHPAGFRTIFNIAPFDIPEGITISDEFYAEVSSFSQYNGDHQYNGAIQYSANSVLEIPDA